MMGGISNVWEGRVALDSDVARLRRGDLDALSALIARYQNRLYRYLLRLVRNEAEAEDLFQETWLRVADKIRGFDANRNFDAWLFTVARNLAIDHLRRVRPQSLDEPGPEGDPGSTMADRLASSERPAIDGILERERFGRVHRALDALPTVYREVLTLRFEEEMKIEDIAGVMGTPVSTVKSRLRRSLVQMRDYMEATQPGVGPQ
jgi:RNA polymerase sigma-70 factor, ECF subfamily